MQVDGAAVSEKFTEPLLGRLDPSAFFGGKITLSLADSTNALRKFRGTASVKKLAAGFIDVVNSNMARAIHSISSMKGYDPRDYALVAFGGAGPLHACELARAVGIKKIIVPTNPGLFSALGAVMVPIMRQMSKTILVTLNSGNVHLVRKAISQLEKRCTRDLSGKVEIKRLVELRYKGQSYELAIEWDNVCAVLLRRFHEEHKRTYGYSRPENEVEVVNCMVVAKEASRTVPFKKARPSDGEFNIDRNKYLRYNLPQGEIFKGPALIIEYTSTTYIPEGFSFVQDKYQNLMVYDTNQS